jgi:hypothetical protein
VPDRATSTNVWESRRARDGSPRENVAISSLMAMASSKDGGLVLVRSFRGASVRAMSRSNAQGGVFRSGVSWRGLRETGLRCDMGVAAGNLRLGLEKRRLNRPAFPVDTNLERTGGAIPEQELTRVQGPGLSTLGPTLR